jgi:transposase
MGASIAGVAMAHGINTNQLHKWRREFLTSKPGVVEPQLLPIAMTAEPEPDHAMQAQPEGSIDIQFLRARLSVRGRVDLDVLQTVLAILRQR